MACTAKSFFKMSSISIQKVNKSYDKGAIQALKDIHFSVEKGELFGLIGPDGAGKSTLIRIISTLLLSDSGKVLVNDLDVVNQYKEVRHMIGYMPGKFSLYQDLSVYENLEFFATLFHTSIEENYGLIKDIYIQLEPFKDRKAGKLSGGMKQKLALCCALIHNPSILLLDEPTTGVDAVSRKEFWQMLKRLKAHGITILVSTPYMDEASLCERIALIQNGEILAVNTPEAIVDSYPYELFEIRSDQMIQLLKDLSNMNEINTCFAFGDTHHISFSNTIENKENDLKRLLEEKGHTQLHLKKIVPTIEDFFIYKMQ